MWRTKIGERTGRVEGVRESSSLASDSGIEEPTRLSWRPGGCTVAARRPRPLHGVTHLNRYRVRRENETAVADGNIKSGRAGMSYSEEHE